MCSKCFIICIIWCVTSIISLLFGVALWTQSFKSRDCDELKLICTNNIDNICPTNIPVKDVTIYCNKCWNLLRRCNIDIREYNDRKNNGWRLLVYVGPIFAGLFIILIIAFTCYINCTKRKDSSRNSESRSIQECEL